MRLVLSLDAGAPLSKLSSPGKHTLAKPGAAWM